MLFGLGDTIVSEGHTAAIFRVVDVSFLQVCDIKVPFQIKSRNLCTEQICIKRKTNNL